jgi:hypothetical protein
MKHWEDHPEPVEGCFGCKGLSLQMNTGDAHSQRSMPTKAFNAKNWMPIKQQEPKVSSPLELL